ncbi:hypothetical protein NEOKW01_1247 [Nematocida sp. AWRm80]|nr:hypothetical protein NEOKW01_1247 [Nematocida sp. AWRm80]
MQGHTKEKEEKEAEEIICGKRRIKEKKTEERIEKILSTAGNSSLSSHLGTGETDQVLLNQMKAEIRRLYGEKVNMANTNYTLKPHEFKCLSKVLSRALWNEERALETTNDIIYAVDSLCNKLIDKERDQIQNNPHCQCTKEKSVLEEINLERERKKKELELSQKLEETNKNILTATIRLRSLLGLLPEESTPSQATVKERNSSEEKNKEGQESVISANNQESKQTRNTHLNNLLHHSSLIAPLNDYRKDSTIQSVRTVPELDKLSSIQELLDLISILSNELEVSGASSIRSLLNQKSILETDLNAIRMLLGIRETTNISQAIEDLQKAKEESYRQIVQSKDKSLECQKRHYESSIAHLTDKIFLLDSENTDLRRVIEEKCTYSNEVSERSAALETNIQEIKQVIEEENQRIQEERKEFSSLKQSLIQQNKQMSQIVQDLIARIKVEQKEKEALLALNPANLIQPRPK